MKPNGEKCHLLVKTEKSVSSNIDGSNVKNKKEKRTPQDYQNTLDYFVNIMHEMVNAYAKRGM